MRAIIRSSVVFTAIFFACSTGDQTPCEVDEDCIFDSCCRSYDVVHVDNAPECDPEMACTSDYEDCSSDDERVFPVCRSGKCAVNMPVACQLVNAL